VRALRDEIVTLLVAGYETTASVLTWAWYLLAHHPSVQQKLFEELDTVLCGQSPGLAELRRLPYTRAVLLETMRLYPPVWIMSRTPVTEDRIGDCVVPAGWLVFLSPYVTHRLRSFWEHPEAFDPDRFLHGTTPNGASHAYFPFGAGPRACIGARFAVLEAELVLAGVAQRYAVRAVSDRPVEPDPLVTLRPRGGVRILLHERSA
jgi:cytochrome P450